MGVGDSTEEEISAQYGDMITGNDHICCYLNGLWAYDQIPEFQQLQVRDSSYNILCIIYLSLATCTRLWRDTGIL